MINKFNSLANYYSTKMMSALKNMKKSCGTKMTNVMNKIQERFDPLDKEMQKLEKRSIKGYLYGRSSMLKHFHLKDTRANHHEMYVKLPTKVGDLATGKSKIFNAVKCLIGNVIIGSGAFVGLGIGASLPALKYLASKAVSCVNSDTLKPLKNVLEDFQKELTIFEKESQKENFEREMNDFVA